MTANRDTLREGLTEEVIWTFNRTRAYLLRELNRLRADLETVGQDLTDDQSNADSWLDVAYGRAANVQSVLSGIPDPDAAAIRLTVAEARADRLSAEVEAKDRAHTMAAHLVVSLCDSVLGNAYLGKDAEEELAADLKRVFARAAVKAETEGSDPLSPARKEDGDA